MLLTIHDANLRKVAFIDNSKQATLNYFNDTWTRYLETGSSTFDFTVFKKAIISDVGRKRAYNHLNEKAFVSFQYKGKTYLHTIRKVEENEQTIKCYGINLNLELINEYANPYKSPKAMTFKEFCDAMGLLSFTFLKIGVNEISTKKISAEWEGSDTKLNRLLSLAKKFGAEIEFDTYLNADSSIKSFVVNVYHENDDTHQGVGRISPTILKYGRNLKTLTRTVDKTNIYNMVRPTGRTENGETVTISGLGAWYVNNAKGEREFYQEGEGLFAPLSKQMYPAAFTSNTMGDQWIRKDMQVESSNPEVIRSTAYRELKKNCYPAVTYEAEGFADLEIGDTVQVYDDGFSPTLLLNMRVSEQSISFTNPTNNKTTFSNAKALENRLSGGIQQRLDQMIEDAKPYIIRISTDNGTVFKNGQGQSVVTPTLLKGNKVINSGWRWSVNGEFRTTSSRFIAKASEFSQKMVLEVSAWIGNKEVATEQITFIDASDGENGLSSYTYYAYSAYSDGRDMTTLPVEGSAYVGQATVTNGVRPTNHTDYVWAKFKGDDGKINAEQLEEINQKIEQKADHALTQEQLNALSEKAGIIQAELEAKASIATVSQWFAEFQQFVKDNAAGKIVSEQNLLTLTQRVASIDVDLGGMAQRWSFLDHYMKAGEEGLIIGKNDGSSSVRISDNRISFYSAGQEVAYISGGVLQIDNGVFTKTLQIGRFREEQYHLNLDMNVIRYVGG
ncbi:phage tail spike protein [Streptococcus acidominimus]|uniref:Tail spike domain-containing protein n=1 Tax=Streptococcus acidominimus TaxID=1326 RepID=A0A4Y9FP33_STRAI|nr:phage tail spike protein [Streptococcus acidominimus]MBF0819134.1 phage tail protein [Streptococcus acidominimus]MBF0838678.1 phage tail protein [Streptococcus acidominimus]MBF0846829.1 phage tail protein [Streptococcus danieliae]TFU30290.1 hypothetical protein E4U01_06730 [Streptococcus acidominimus]